MNPSIYRTTNLPFSAWLLSTKRLRFMGKENPSGNSLLTTFLFDDQAGIGEEAFAEYLASGYNTFFESIKILRQLTNPNR